MECKNKFNYDVNIELINETNNCYIYENAITTGNIIFGYWYNTIIELKQRYPKNKLIKNLSSALWGRISENNRLFKTEQECEDEDIDYRFNYNPNHKYYVRDITYNKHKEPLYELISTTQPYKYNVARIKPFL
jgi:hypothetical protein